MTKLPKKPLTEYCGYLVLAAVLRVQSAKERVGIQTTQIIHIQTEIVVESVLCK